MSLLQKIPVLSETTDQLIDVELGGNPYTIRILWNERFGYFALSLFSAAGEVLLQNIKMVKNFPLISRFKNNLMPYGDIYFVQEKGTNARPDYEDLGVNCGLYYYEPDVVTSAQPVRLGAAEAVLGTIWDSGLSAWDSDSSVWDT